MIALPVVLVLLVSSIAAFPNPQGGRAEAQTAAAADRKFLGLHVYPSLSVIPVSERGWIRNHKVEVSWASIEPYQGAYNWAWLDSLVNDILASGSESLFFLLGGPIPTWARDSQYGSLADKAPPQNLGDWYSFCSKVAERYGAVVDFYEIWNEPGWDRDSEAYRNSGVYHFGGQVETDYLPLLQLGYTAVKEMDPTASVICGALMYTLKDDPNSGTENYAMLFDDVNRPGQDISLKVEAGLPIVAERPMYFNYKGTWNGGHDVLGATAAGKEWYFAEGTTRGGFDEWLCLQNPNAGSIQVTITYMFGPGQGGNLVKDYFLQPNSRTTLMVNNEVGPGKDVSIKLTSGSDFIAERPMYFNYQGAWTGGHDVVGATAAGREWYFAEGTTRGGFDEWLCLQNPNAGPIQVTATFMFGPGQGSNKTETYNLDPTSRTTFKVNDLVGSEKDVSIKITSGSDFIAERPMYFNYQGAWTGGHDVVGAKSPSTTWYFAEGCTGFSIQEYVCLQNPHAEAVTAKLTFMMTKGEMLERIVSLAPNSRTTLNINMLIGFHGTSDMVAVHPYKSPWYWGGFYTNVVNTLRSRGAGQEVVTSEVGWPHYSDNGQPAVFNESAQAAAIGNEGVKRLFDAGCRKIWVYRDVDESPGTSWDGNYYGLFSHTGSPHPAWNTYVQWQQQLPAYPKLPTSFP